MKKLLLIGTGGTIASRETGDGLSPGLQAEEIVSFVPEVRNLCEIEVLQLCNIDSTNMNPKIWRELVQAIKENFDRYDGFVVLHGTDTMAYTSAVLSYMIQHSRKPIVVTGSQKPIDRELLAELAETHQNFVTLEENVLRGGFGLEVAEWASSQEKELSVTHIALPDAYVEHGDVSVLRQHLGIDSDSIVRVLRDKYHW